MGDYFKPWQRKIGVVTLVTACVFMAGWARSGLIHDVLRGGPGDIECFIISHAGLFSIWIGPDSSTPKFSWITFGPNVTNPATHPGTPIPYSTIAIPLTLLSVYLLLSQPKSRHPQNVVESVTAAGT